MNVNLLKICPEFSRYDFEVFFKNDLTQETYIPTYVKWTALTHDGQLAGNWTTANPTTSSYLVQVPAGINGVSGSSEQNKARVGRYVFMIVKPPGVANDVFYTHLFQYWVHHLQGVGD